MGAREDACGQTRVHRGAQRPGPQVAPWAAMENRPPASSRSTLSESKAATSVAAEVNPRGPGALS